MFQFQILIPLTERISKQSYSIYINDQNDICETKKTPLILLSFFSIKYISTTISIVFWITSQGEMILVTCTGCPKKKLDFRICALYGFSCDSWVFLRPS